ncbi:hypothetical protein Agub_g3590 [Astrephomene gubernaculifera]|uniref:Uncharacterized protein n=1 Tax=Astrephomene gubernaculifera TaxID=47775 RepID=A0AAD3DL71_9CHLO|nr:hypothetical protein Agub_g3590 [Astrephomene gubernaculifera]
MLSLPTSSFCSSVVSNALVATAALPAATRRLTALSWGRNVEGQCGIDSSLLVFKPTPVFELHESELSHVAAGKLNSAAVTTHGEAWTWGDGKGGKLGHGSADHVHAPHRIESLVGRADVRQLALGDHHTLFVDGSGSLWACGENKEGQCGLGTPLEVIATQHRRAHYESFRAFRDSVAAEPRVSREQRAKQAIHALLGTSPQHAQQHGHANGAHGGSGSGWQGHGHGSAAPGRSSSSSGWQHLAAAGTHHAGGSGAGGQMYGSATRTALNFSGLDFESAFAASGIHPGQQPTPLRIGRDQHPLWDVVAGAAGRATAAAGGLPLGDMRVVLPSGLEGETVVGVAASRFFSAALTAAGEVWTFGACYNGCLGSDSSWSSSAQRVSGALAASLEDGGGAKQVVSGGTFCAALTAAGRVVLWGRVPGSEAEGGGLADAAEAHVGGGGGGGRMLGMTEQGVDIVTGGRLLAGVVPGLPPITHIAAGQQHLLMSDGSRVWVLGRMLDASGAVALTAPWRRPALALTLPAGDAVRQLVAGVHSAGVVSELGEAWVWGRLLDRHHVDSVAKRHPNLAFGGADVGNGGAGSATRRSTRTAAAAAAAASPLLPEDVRWEWAGYGGREARRLEGLGGPVRALALGGWHAMAVVE